MLAIVGLVELCEVPHDELIAATEGIVASRQLMLEEG